MCHLYLTQLFVLAFVKTKIPKKRIFYNFHRKKRAANPSDHTRTIQSIMKVSNEQCDECCCAVWLDDIDQNHYRQIGSTVKFCLFCLLR